MHPRLLLLPGWDERLRAAPPSGQPAEPVRIVPRSPELYAGALTVVEDRAGAEEMLDLARQRAISWIGIDCKFCFSRPTVPIGKGRSWSDPRSIVPLLMGITLVEGRDDGAATLYDFAIDLRRPEVFEPLAALLRQPVPFAGHHLRWELFCLWALCLPIPRTVWDTCTAERAFQLGLYHERYRTTSGDEAEWARRREEVEEDIDFLCSLPATCERRGVPYGFASARDRVRKSFATTPHGLPFTEEQREYVVVGAKAAARLYPIQVQQAILRNALDHLKVVEMPWGITNAEMIWNGVRIDLDLCKTVTAACASHEAALSARLEAFGISNVNSGPALETFFRSIGLLDAFRKDGGYSFDDDHLAVVEDRHEAIPMTRALRKIRQIVSARLLGGELVGADGRLHPDHRPLGAESGRNTMRDPNIGGIGRALRPLVVPDDPVEWGVGEVDLGQIEIFIAAAESSDPDLIAMVNSGDVYCNMARRYYADRLPAEDCALADDDFKKAFGVERDRMKIFTLAIIYNITPDGLAWQLGISVPQAAEERDRFLAMFPVLDRAMREASAYGAIRGYAQLCTGLRRQRARRCRPSAWETNWLRNTPIQGSASVVFKLAGNRLRLRYQPYGARLIMPLHDAYVFECPLEHMEAVARITSEVMRGTVQEYYPMLVPRVEVNISQPHCWNKDGMSRSLELWLEDSGLARRYLRSGSP